MAAGRAKTSGRRKAVLPAGLNCATAFQQIARDCITGIAASHASACAGDTDAVYQTRVAITRLRSAVSFFAPVAVDAQWLRIRQEIKWLNASLGVVRDNDVMTGYARRKSYRAWADHAIGADFHERGKQDRRKLMRCLRSGRVRRLFAALSAWVERGRWLARGKAAVGRGDAAPLRGYCERELDRWRQRLVRQGRHLSRLNGARRHRLRIRAKRLRYVLEALTGIVAMQSRADISRMHSAAKRLQRALGEMRDLDRFARLSPADKRGKRRPPGYRRRQEKLGNAAVRAWRDLKRAGPR